MGFHTITLSALQEKALTLRLALTPAQGATSDAQLQSLVDTALQGLVETVTASDNKALLDAVKSDPTLLAAAQAKVKP